MIFLQFLFNKIYFFPGIVIYGDQSAAIARLVDCEKKKYSLQEGLERWSARDFERTSN